MSEQKLNHPCDTEKLYDLAELFKAFGDSTRIRIMYTLTEGEMCVQDVATIMNQGLEHVLHCD